MPDWPILFALACGMSIGGFAGWLVMRQRLQAAWDEANMWRLAYGDVMRGVARPHGNTEAEKGATECLKT